MTEPSSLITSAWMLYVSKHYPRLSYKVDKGVVSVNGLELNKTQASQPQWKLMPQDLKQRINNVDSAVEATLAKYRIPVRSAGLGSAVDAYGNAQAPTAAKIKQTLYLRGFHIVPETKLAECVEALQQHDADLKAIVQEVCNDLEAFKASIREQLGDEAVYQEARKNIPTAAAMMEKTGVEWVPFPLGPALSDATGTNQAVLHEAVQSRMTAFVDGVVESIIEEPRQELHAALANLNDLIDRDGRVTARSFEPINRAIEKLRSFNISDNVLEEKIQNLQMRLENSTPESRTRSAAESSGLSAAIRSTMEETINATSIEMQYGAARGLHFDLTDSTEAVAN